MAAKKRRRPPGKKRALTAKQKRFVLEYLLDMNATQAAVRAGYSAKTAATIGSELLRNPAVAAAIEARRSAVAAKLELKNEDIVRELQLIGFSNIVDIAEFRGRTIILRDSGLLTREVLAAVSSVKETQVGLAVTLHPKIEALIALMKHRGMLVERHKLEVPTGSKVNIYLPDNRRRDPKPAE